ILVDINHSLALNEHQICMNLICDSYICLLTYHDYHIDYLQLLLTLTIDILVHPNECEQYIHLLLIVAKQLDKSNVISYYL
ncbi:unnamed protein product, partial [Rotaria sp. Silwood1]